MVLVLGIMLAAWCCKGQLSVEKTKRIIQPHSRSFLNIGSFKNPLCCPCYLCACCGGLGKALYFLLLILKRLITFFFFSPWDSMFGMHCLWTLRRRPFRDVMLEIILFTSGQL